jgi:CheY-like chemotaxis protein
MTESNILVVDDDADIRRVVGEVLSDEGLRVDTAADGREALQRAEAARPSLVILDITLPILDGYQVADRLRHQYGEVPILAVTADGRAADKARRVGAFAYLRKPFELAELVALVKRGLSKPD